MTDRSKPLYMIGVVAEMLKVHPQTLRMYEREGLIRPARIHRMRLYSERDIQRVRHIQSYTRMGVNLEGVKFILDLLDKWEQARQEIEDLRALVEGSSGRGRSKRSAKA